MINTVASKLLLNLERNATVQYLIVKVRYWQPPVKVKRSLLPLTLALGNLIPVSALAARVTPT